MRTPRNRSGLAGGSGRGGRSGATPGTTGGGVGGGVASPGAKPGGFGNETSRSRPNAASPASYNPPFSPTRGSPDVARGLVGTGLLDVCPAQIAGKETNSANETARQSRGVN